MPRTTSPRRLAQLTVASLTVIGLLAVQAGAAVPAKTVPPKQWAKTVCPALADFVGTFQSIDKQLSTGVDTPEAQEIILSGIEATIGSADDVAATIKRAGGHRRRPRARRPRTRWSRVSMTSRTRSTRPRA